MPAVHIQFRTNNNFKNQKDETLDNDYQRANVELYGTDTIQKKDTSTTKQNSGNHTNSSQQTTSGSDGTLTRTAQHVMYELIAHGLAYSNTLNQEQNELLTSWGYIPGWFDLVNDNKNTGLFVGLLIPSEEGRMVGRKPIVAFRGSETSDPDSKESQFSLDWLQNDMDPYAVGYTAFMLNYNKIEQLIAEGQQVGGDSVVVVGHSLGGSLASQAAIHFPDFIASAVTFQSPGINPEQVNQVERRQKSGLHTPDMTSYTAEGDIVDWAGGGRYPGATRIQIDPNNAIDYPIAHTQYLLSTPDFANAQSELANASNTMSGGSDFSYDRLLRQSSPGHPTAIGSDRSPYISTDTTHEQIEAVRQALIAEMYHPNADLILNFSDRIASMPLPGRINIMQSLMIRPNYLLAIVSGGLAGAFAGALIGGAIGAVGGTIAGGVSGAAGGAAFGSLAGPLGTAGGAIVGGTSGAVTGGISGALAGIGPGALTGAIIGAAANTAFAAYRDYNTTQLAINRMLVHSSATDKVAIIEACGGIEAFYRRLWLANESDFHANLVGANGYYAGLSETQGAVIIKNHLNTGWMGIGNDDSEVIIADLLTNHTAPESVITLVGGGDYDNGLEKILRTLQGGEDRIVSSRFQFRNRSRGWFW